MPADLNKYVIELALRGRFGRPFRYFDAIGSTNAEALEWSREGAPHGAVVVADHQLQGRGRRGRSWFSEPGTALQLSVVLRPVLPLDVFGLISTALGLACAEALDDATGLEILLKWPNDLTVGGRKLGGILVESRVVGHLVDVAVAGIGINVIPPPGELPPALGARATSIAAELEASGRGRPIDRSQLLAAVLEGIEQVYPLVETGRGAQAILERATARSDVIGREVAVRLSDGSTVSGVATRLLPSGALELQTGESHISLHAGDIEHLRRARSELET